MYSRVSYIYHVAHYILSIYLSYNWKFVPFGYIHPIPLPPLTSPPLVTTNLIFFFLCVCLFVCFVFNLFLYLFLAVLGLRFCARAFSSCGKWGPLFIAVRGPLTIAASLVVEHRLQTRRLSSCGSRV